MTNDSPTITLIAPFLKEEENLPLLYDRLVAALKNRPEAWRLTLVNDGSIDGSTKWIREKSADIGPAEPRR